MLNIFGVNIKVHIIDENAVSYPIMNIWQASSLSKTQYLLKLYTYTYEKLIVNKLTKP